MKSKSLRRTGATSATVPRAAPRALLEIEAGAEGAARARDHQGADGIILLDLVHEGVGLVDHPAVEGVEALRPVEGQEADRPLRLEE